jgi:hypothetical protein
MVVLIFSVSLHQCFAQELFVISEPASNMPAKAISLRLTDKFMNGHRHSVSGDNKYILMHRIVPEVAIGLDKKVNVRISAFLANYYQAALKLEGFNMYVKYRFFSKDDLPGRRCFSTLLSRC